MHSLINCGWISLLIVLLKLNFYVVLQEKARLLSFGNSDMLEMLQTETCLYDY